MHGLVIVAIDAVKRFRDAIIYDVLVKLGGVGQNDVGFVGPSMRI